MFSPKECPSSFPGKIDEIPGICVDNFEKAARAYFLSHYHEDHIVGIDADLLRIVLKKAKAKIYASKVTAIILRVKHLGLNQYVEGLETGPTSITLPATEELPENSLTVTLIPADHCTGSTMFLFTTAEKKNILFTGDFRIDCDGLPECTPLHENGAPIKLDTLYIDTTFIAPDYEHLPKRSESVRVSIAKIREWLDLDSNNEVAICTPAKYSYDILFDEIYEQLGCKVFVSRNRWNVYREIQDIVKGVTNCKTETRIHLCNVMKDEQDKENLELISHNICGIGDDEKKYLYVNLTAMKWRNSDSWVSSDNDGILSVCFATHCSRREIYNFVDHLSSDRIVGFPNKFITRTSAGPSMLMTEN
ncbi:protein artemis-like [Maniola jurtina]|uniref:protein artemis-like n=1 Tax=Maniola jurtina TaxID=191418 RepID=UPI001E687BF5|nr:protein artemis-like [Maniola jurtina]